MPKKWPNSWKARAQPEARIFGSAAGTAPGIPLSGGVVLPLNYDPYFALTLFKPFLGIFGSFVGLLDSSGSASADLTLPAGADPGLAGVVLHHAVTVTETFGTVDLVSGAIALTLAP